MKIIMSCFVAVILLAAPVNSVFAQDFYYCGNSVYNVSVSNTKITVQVKTGIPSFDMGQFIGAHPCLSASVPPEDIGRNCAIFALQSGCSYAAAAPDIAFDPAVARVFPVYDFPGGNADFAVTDLVSVQFDESLPTDSAEAILTEFGLHRIDSCQFRHNYWWCALDDSITDSPLHYGNALHVLPQIEWSSATMYARAEFQSEPSDPYFAYQYYLKNTGQNGGVVGADINVEPAWQVPVGGCRVAILDDGFIDHPDLPEPRLNPVWDFGDWDPDQEGPFGDADVRPGETQNHGMACAGIIAASHNGIGVAGICPSCDVLGIKIGKDNGGISTDPRVIINAIGLAYVFRADVISNSWSYNDTTPITDVYNAIKFVTDPCAYPGAVRDGILMVFSAGNYANKFYGPNQVAFPANMPQVIAVGAIDKSNQRWDYSCYGDALDVVAPTGADTYLGSAPNGDVWTLDQPGALGWNPFVTGVNDANGDIDYTSRMGGTSAACAEVAGVVALIQARRPDLRNGCAPYETYRQILGETATDLGPSGKDAQYGYGRVNAYRALLSVIHGDVNNDGTINALDLGAMIDVLFAGQNAALDNATVDFDCDGFGTALDLGKMIDYLFAGGPRPPICTQY